MHRPHPSAPARLAVYALFAFLLGLQAFFAPTKGTSISVVAIFCLIVSLSLALVAISIALFTHAPLTASPPPSASSAVTAFFVATWLAPFHYFVFYLALFALAAMVAIPVNVFQLSQAWLAVLVLLALSGCFVLEYAFLFLLRVAADAVPAALLLPADQ